MDLPALVECIVCGQRGYIVFDGSGKIIKVRFSCSCPQMTESEMNLLLTQLNNKIGRGES